MIKLCTTWGIIVIMGILFALWEPEIGIIVAMATSVAIIRKDLDNLK